MLLVPVSLNFTINRCKLVSLINVGDACTAVCGESTVSAIVFTFLLKHSKCLHLKYLCSPAQCIQTFFLLLIIHMCSVAGLMTVAIPDRLNEGR